MSARWSTRRGSWDDTHFSGRTQWSRAQDHSGGSSRWPLLGALTPGNGHRRGPGGSVGDVDADVAREDVRIVELPGLTGEGDLTTEQQVHVVGDREGAGDVLLDEKK